MHGVTSVDPVGRVHGHAAHDVVADVRFHLEHDGPAVCALELQRLEELGLVSGVELHVDDRADHLADATLARALLFGLWRFRFCLCHLQLLPQLEPLTASEPLTISMSSVVMPACRTLFA